MTDCLPLWLSSLGVVFWPLSILTSVCLMGTSLCLPGLNHTSALCQPDTGLGPHSFPPAAAAPTTWPCPVAAHGAHAMIGMSAHPRLPCCPVLPSTLWGLAPPLLAGCCLSLGHGSVLPPFCTETISEGSLRVRQKGG